MEYSLCKITGEFRIFDKTNRFVAPQMKDKDPNKVRNWRRPSTRIDPDTDKKFQEKLSRTGDKESEVIRKAVRNYTKD